MKVAPSVMKVALVLGFSVPLKLAAQIPIAIVDMPFTATWVETRHEAATTRTETKALARASNGNSYMAFLSPIGGPFPAGTPYQVMILDVVNQRIITLYPANRNYHLQHTKLRTSSAHQYAQTLQNMQNSYAQNPDRIKPDGKNHDIALGAKQQDGMMIYGAIQEFTSDTGSKRATEIWQSDLGIETSKKTLYSPVGNEVTGTLTNVHREEPDSKLFAIPEGYVEFPATNPPIQKTKQ
jgi:hypothetical protein